MGNNVSLADIVDQLYAFKPDERSEAFDELCKKHKCIKSYLLSKWKPERENKPRVLTVKKVVDTRDKLNSKDCTKWKHNPLSFWSPSYTLISKEDVHSPLAFVFDATILSDAKGHEECTRQRFISLFWYDYFREEYGEGSYDKEYTDVGRNIQNVTKNDIETIITTLRHRVRTGRKFDKLAARFGDGILLTIPSSVSRSTLEQYLPLEDSAFEDWIEPLVGSPWEAQANEPEVDSAGQLIRLCLLQKTSTKPPSTKPPSTKPPSTKPPSTKRPRSNDQSGSSLPESQQAYELGPNSKRHKTNRNTNTSDKASKGHGTTTETAVQSRMAVQNLLLDYSSPESSNTSVVNLGYCTNSSTNGFHNQTIVANTGSQGTYDTLNISRTTTNTGFGTGYNELQVDQGQQNMGLGIPESEELQDQGQQNIGLGIPEDLGILLPEQQEMRWGIQEDVIRGWPTSGQEEPTEMLPLQQQEMRWAIQEEVIRGWPTSGQEEPTGIQEEVIPGWPTSGQEEPTGIQEEVIPGWPTSGQEEPTGMLPLEQQEMRWGIQEDVIRGWPTSGQEEPTGMLPLEQQEMRWGIQEDVIRGWPTSGQEEPTEMLPLQQQEMRWAIQEEVIRGWPTSGQEEPTGIQEEVIPGWPTSGQEEPTGMLPLEQQEMRWGIQEDVIRGWPTSGQEEPTGILLPEQQEMRWGGVHTPNF